MDGYERFVCMGACLNGNMKSSNRYGQQSVCVRARVHAILFTLLELLNPAFSHTLQQNNFVHELPEHIHCSLQAQLIISVLTVQTYFLFTVLVLFYMYAKYVYILKTLKATLLII